MIYNVFVLVFQLTIMFRSCLITVDSFRLASFARFKSSAKKSVRTTGTSLHAAMQPVRVRFAPSPTGSLHVGGARTALYNWLLARKTNGSFIIRVEDTDEARSTRASETSILNDLKWLKLDWDEGPGIEGPHSPYRQSERKAIYAKAAQQLINEGFAYRCFCTDEELESRGAADKPNHGDGHEESTNEGSSMRFYSPWRNADPAEVQARIDRGDSYTVRFKVPSKSISILDKVRGVVTWETDAALLGDFVILRSSGMPVYNFCVSVDDAEMGITHVVRAEEHLSNTLRQMLILEALYAKPPTYAHCSLILAPDRSKLSKRHGATSVCQFSEQGFVPEAMVNYLANLGWNDGTDKEIYSIEELIQAFDLSRIVKSSAVFDLEKLKWLNTQHLRMRTPEQMQPIVLRGLCTGEDAVLPAHRLPAGTLSATATPSEPVVTENVAVPTESATAADTGNAEQFNQFMQSATKIVQRDIELLTDINRLVCSCLAFNLTHTLRTDSHVGEVLAESAFPTVLKALVDDYHSGTLPRGTTSGGEVPFADVWKAYMKDLGKRLNLKGKALFHPVRLCLTGRVSGPDVGDQLQLLALSEGLLCEGTEKVCVRLDQRIAMLESFDLQEALKEVERVKAE